MTDGLTDDEEKIQQILDRCELHLFKGSVRQMLIQAVERLYYSESLKIGNARLPQAKVRSYLNLLNKPILESILTDDRFDTLKKLCEDKELTSYEAASTFAKKLSELLEDKPFQTKVRYIFVISDLNEQVDRIVEQIQQNKQNPQKNSAEKLLPLYERIYKKRQQIAKHHSP